MARYQLLFQRTIPGFEPTPEAFAPAVRALEAATEQLNRVGVTDPRQIDMWTAWITGLVDQQISNDPGGDRWARLIEDFIAMFFVYIESTSPPAPGTKPKATTRGATR